MQTKWINRSELPERVSAWMQDYDVYTPFDNGTELAFQLLKDVGLLHLDTYDNTRYPPKSLFLPQSEVLMQFEGILKSVELEQKQKIVLGMHPCDAHAAQLLTSALVDEKNPDLFWQNKKKSAVIVSRACVDPPNTCFCTSVGGSPFNTKGSDALLVDVEDGFIIQVLTEKAERLFADLPDASQAQLKQMEQVSADVLQTMPEAYAKQELHDKLESIFETDFWKEISQSCLGCGVCTFLCPTCFCFDIVDETVRKERVRNWDSCMFRIYSQEASGHNPRPTKAERTRQRVMHKYAYWVDQIDEIGCTGCGRCVTYCPVNIDIREIVSAAMQWEKEGVTK